MIPVAEQPEPGTFNDRVRIPGSAFLRRDPHPKRWDNRDYWKRVLPELYNSYNGICAYCAHWIPRDTGVATVDHFIPKSVKPQLAYEWSNYRLAALRFNGRKGDYQDVLDPFSLQPNWFVLEFPSLLIKPHTSLSVADKRQVAYDTEIAAK